MNEKASKERIDILVKRYGYIKVNIAESMDSYRSGNGEGIWAVVVDDESHKLYRDNAVEGQITVIACNDSVFYPGEIVYGDEIPCILRGEGRPMVVWDILHGTKTAQANKEDTLRKLGVK